MLSEKADKEKRIQLIDSLTIIKHSVDIVNTNLLNTNLPKSTYKPDIKRIKEGLVNLKHILEEEEQNESI